MTFAASIFTTSNMLLAVVHHFSNHPAELAELRERMAVDFPAGIRSATSLPNNPTLQMLLPVLLQNSAVGLVVRDVLVDRSFTDCEGNIHQMRKGDLVTFDLSALQASLRTAQQERLAQAPAGRFFLDFLDARNNDVTVAFFGGAFQCPGRYLAMLDSLAFSLALFPRVDARFLDAEKKIMPGLVNRMSGSPMVEIRTPQSVEYELHAALLAHRPPGPKPPAQLAAPGNGPRAAAPSPVFSACPMAHLHRPALSC